MTHKQVVEAVRARFPGQLYPDHSAAFLVQLCQALQAEFPMDPEAGLRLKDTGTHTTLPDGINVALDIVMYPAGTAFDVLTDSDGAATPAWNAIGSLPPEWYVAVGGITPPPPDDLTARVTALEAQVSALAQTTIKVGDPVLLRTHHDRWIRAGDAGEDYQVNQAEVPADWERLGIWRG